MTLIAGAEGIFTGLPGAAMRTAGAIRFVDGGTCGTSSSAAAASSTTGSFPASTSPRFVTTPPAS
jgi:hypothetical protein